MSKKRIWLSVVVVVTGAAYFWINGKLSRAATSSIHTGALYTVRRGSLVINLVENGSLAAKDSKKLTSKMRGQSKILSVVPEGEPVKENQEVCRFDDTELNKSLAQEELSLLTAETTLSTARTGLELQQMDNASKTEKAKVALEKTKMELERYREGDSPQDLRKLDIDRKDAEYQLEKAKKRLSDSKKLMKEDYIKQTELEEHQIAFEKATVESESATLAMELYKKYEFPITLATKANAHAEAKRTLAAELKRGKSQLLQKQVAVTQAEKRVTRVKEGIDKIRKDVEQLVVKAPCPGVVIYGDPRSPWNREQIKIGGVVWRGQTMMTIPDLRLMLVKLSIHEADINRIKKDQRVTVSMDTYPGVILAGKVSKVAQVAVSSNAWGMPSSVKKFAVEVLIEDTAGLQLKPGISAKAEILIDTLESALFVPIQCAFLEGEFHYCNVMEGGTPSRRKVEIGASNSTHVQILDGLKEGEQVLLYNPNLEPDKGQQPAGRRDDDKAASEGAGDPTAGGQK